jgi:hypothetical protein
VGNIENILSYNIFVLEKYKNKKLSTLATDLIDDGTIVYDMNEHGYRSNSIKEKSDFNILTLGCSWTMGIGLNVDETWPMLIGNEFGKTFNYSMYGVSTSFVAKTFYKFVSSQFTPNLVLIMWPGFSRRDYMKDDGSFKKVGGFRTAHSKDIVWKNETEDLLFLELRNDYQDLMIFWESYKFVETIAKLYNIKIFHKVAGYYHGFFEPKNCYKNDKLARDGEHPGKNWHYNFSQEFLKFIKNKI